MKPLVAHFVESLEIGGAERLVCDFVEGRGRETTSVICLELIGVMGEALRAKGFSVTLIGLERIRLRTVHRLAEFLQKNPPDILHCHNLTTHLFGRLAVRYIVARGGKSIPVLMTKHGAMQPVAGLVGFLNRRLAKETQSVAVSSEALDLMSAWLLPGSRPPVFVANAIALEAYRNHPTRDEARKILGWPADAFTIGIVARFAISKGHMLLIDTFARLLQEIPSARLVLVGDGQMRAQIERRIAELRIEPSVSLLGERHDIPLLLAALDVFCLPSETEGMPITLLEAMATSLPVVITRVGAVPAMIEDGVTGLLIPPFDSMALERALLRVARNPEQARAMGEAGCRLVEKRYSIGVALAEYEKLYAELLKS